MELTQKCLDIFYNHIIKEAQSGRVDCFFMYNIIFSTQIENEPFKPATTEYQDLLIPTLQIKNKVEFDQLLVEYVRLCLDFYGDKNYPEEILTSSNDLDPSICREKTIMTLLFANATNDDFSNPCDFLRRRISFFQNTQPVSHQLGFSQYLQGNLIIEISKDIINNETPYQFKIKAVSKNNEEYIFPSIKFGISDNKLYVYAIQNNFKDTNSYVKKIKRLLYKVGEGFDISPDSSIQDITPSFVVAANILVAYFHQFGINDIVVSSILLPRWNSKKISHQLRFQKGYIDENQFQELEQKQFSIQSNLTEKFLRTFLRLQHHYDGIEITAIPFQVDSNLHVTIHQLAECNNQLLSETRNLVLQSISFKNQKTL